MNWLARCAAFLALFAPASPVAAQMPRFFHQASGVGAGSMFLPPPPVGPFGFATPRLFPSFGGGFYGPSPIISIGVGTPIYPSPYYMQPIVVSPSIEPIEILNSPNAGPMNAGPIGGQPAGRFRPVGPLDRERARMAPPAAVNPPPPADPMVESARLIREAKRAFGDGEYGRAGELLQKAVAAVPTSAEGHLLLGQAWFALGKYADAVAAIHAGVRLKPDWPDVGPPLVALYGARSAEFEFHQQMLSDAAKAAPNDAVLQFLSGYVAWFADREDEARQLFAALRRQVADSAVIDLFLAEP
jgi:Tetratricopeptide repeat